MISIFLLIFAIQDGLAIEDATLRDVVNGLQITINEMNGKVERLENEVKVRVVLVNLNVKQNIFLATKNNSYQGSQKQKSTVRINHWNERDWGIGFTEILEFWKIRDFRIIEKKTDVNYLLMEMTKITDRLDILESESNDENEETKSAGAVHIEFNGLLFSEYKTELVY